MNTLEKLVGKWWIIALVLIITCAVYLPSLNGPYILDDQTTIFQNPIEFNSDKVSSYSLIQHIRERTFSLLSFYINGRIVDRLSPANYRIINYILHLINGLLVYSLAQTISQSSGNKRNGRLLGFIAMTLFLLHPIQSQAVNYVTQRMILLATGFSLTSAILYLKIRTLESSLASSWLKRGALLIFISMALLSKPTAICLFPILLVIELLIIKNKLGKSQWIGFWMLGILLIIGAGLSIQGFIDTPRISSTQYLLSQLIIVLRYLALLVWPFGFSLDHSTQLWPNIPIWQLLGSGFVHLIILVLALIFRRKAPVLSLGIFVFYFAIFPESALIPLKDLMSEHRMYLPMVGISLLFASLVTIQLRLVWLIYMALVLITTCAGLTFNRNIEWKTSETLWASAIDLNPSSGRALYSIGRAYLMQGDTIQAQQCFSSAIKSDPSHVPSKNGLALILIHQNKFSEAQKLLEYAIELEPFDVTSAQNMGYLFERQMKLHKALGWYKKAQRFSNGDPAIHLDIATVFLKLDKPKKAMDHFEKALDGEKSARLYNNLGYAHELLGNNSQAIVFYNKALSIDIDYKQAVQNLQRLSK